jgi:hypothetical protein
MDFAPSAENRRRAAIILSAFFELAAFFAGVARSAPDFIEVTRPDS